MSGSSEKSGFPSPLQIGVLEYFCHPAPGHVLAAPAHYDGQALAGNGYMALRVDRGLWTARDFEEAPAGFLTRFLALPWRDVSGLPAGEWRALDDVRGNLYRYAPIRPWTDKHRCAPTPVWRVGRSFLARLSHLQMLARLPRCEVYAGPADREEPLRFRFAGGHGMLARDKRLEESSGAIFAPRYDVLGGERMARETRRPQGLGDKFKNWPPPEPVDD
jgi:hypothetical protein